MVLVENSVLINADLETVFQIAADVEKYPEFIPTYKEVKILERQADKMIVERTGLLWGKPVKWKSQVKVEENKSITAEQLEGPLKGMKIHWWFKEVTGGTTIVLSHEFEYKIPLIGTLVEKWIVAKIISKMAQDTLDGIRKRVEGTK